MNSRQKGARGEREWAKWLQDRGYSARRGQQFSGSPDSPDVICESLPIHWEVKRVQALNLDAALAQATNDSPKNKVPVVAHRRDGKNWKITLDAEAFFCHFVSQALQATTTKD